MIHPLIRLMATQPQLLAEHLGAYAALIGSEMQQVKTKLVLRLVLIGLALCLVGVATVLAGVSLMLWAVTPTLTDGGRWALVLVPALPAVAAVAAGLYARTPVTESSFEAVQAQIEADARMLTEVGAA
jgi:uncharacterized membrane protein YqjE